MKSVPVVGNNLKAPKPLTLKQLNQTQDEQPTLGDVFPVNVDEDAPVVNLPSSVNMAAHAAALSPEDTSADNMINSYRQALAEDTLEGQSSTATGLFNQAKSVAMKANSNDLLDILANPNIPDSQKQAAANATYDAHAEMYSPQNLLSNKALDRPVGMDDNSELEKTRYQIGSATLGINNSKQQIQQIYNGSMTATDPNLARKAVSLLLGFVPLPVKTYMVAKMNADQSDAPVRAFLSTFLEGKGAALRAMRDHIAELPADQQAAAAQNLANIINEHSNILMVPDDSVRREALQATLSYQGYGNAQQFAANVGSWVDDLVGVSTLKAVGNVAKGVRAANEAAATDNFFKNWKYNFDNAYNNARASQSKDLVPTGGEGKGGSGGAPSPSDGPEIKPLAWNSYERTPPEVKPDDVVSNVKQDSVRSQVQPVSVYENFKDSNPEMARDAFDSVTLDPTGEVAKALGGTSRNDMIFGTMAPEIAHGNGAVKSKVLSPDAMADLRDQVPFDVMDLVAHDGKTQYVQAEKAAAQSYKVNQFESAIGFTPRGEMFQIRPNVNNFTYTPHGVSVTAVYGPRNTGFTDPFDAVELSKFALRNTGISEKDLGLLRRVDGQYIPTSLDEIPKLKEKASVWVQPTATTGPIDAEAVSSKGMRFDLTDSPIHMNVNLGGDKWIREIVAKDKDTGQEIGKLTYANHDMPPSIEVSPKYRRQGVATAMLKMAKNQGGVLGDNITGKFAGGAETRRSAEGQAFRAGNNLDSVSVYLKNVPFMDDYLVAVNHDAHIGAGDVSNAPSVIGGDGWSKMDVKLNFFDRWVPFGGRQGTFSNIILDQASMLDPTITTSAVAAADKVTYVEKSLLRMVQDFSDKFKALSKTQKNMLHSEILSANLQRRESDYNRLIASGMSQDSIDALKLFRKFHDAIWVLRNDQLASHLATQGWKEFVHTKTNTSFPAKPIGKVSVPHNVNVYNPASDALENVSKDDIDLLYKNGGGIARMKYPFQMQDGTKAEYILHRNDPTGGYLRDFSKDSQVLNYIPGYYGIHYKDPWHIIEKVKDDKGNVLFEHSVTTAKDIKSARLLKSRKQATNSNNEYYIRKDRGLNSDERMNDELDEHMSAGRTAFRRRGKLLEDSDSQITDLSHSHVENPVETMVRAATSISKKVVMQDVIDAIEQRALNQYGDFLPKNEFGEPYIPMDMRRIKYRGLGDQNQSEVANARTTFGYINYLRHGYVNVLDDGIKSILQNVADVVGDMGLSKAERGLRGMSDSSLTRGLNSVTYYAYLGTAPIRQLLIQANQALLLSALNPQWVLSPKAFTQTMYIATRTLGADANHSAMLELGQRAWGDSVTANRVFEQFRRSGFSTAVDHQNLVSGAVNDLAKNMIAASHQTALSAVTKPLHMAATTLRKVGFDAGEFFSMGTAWLAHRDLAERSGMNPFSDDVADKIAGAARNYTGNMNFAGDMASNRNALSLIFKYTQNTQKLLLNLTTNRSIPWQLKLKLAALSVMLFGTGSTLFFGTKLNSIQDPNAREIVRQGSEGWLFNKTLSLAFGGESHIDWSALSPYNAYGMMDLIHGMFTTNIGQILANSPGGSLFFGNNPRITEAMKNVARYTHLIDDYQDPTTLLDVANGFAKISSGYSALAKAKYMLELNKKVATSGTISPETYDKVNAIGVLMGFQTVQDAERYYVNNQIYGKRQEVIDDTTNFYKELKSHYVDKRLTGNELLYTQRMLNEAHRMGFLDTDLGRETFNKLLERDLKDGNAAMYNNIMANCPLFNKGDCLDLIKAAPFQNEDDRKSLIDLVNFGNQYKEPDYDENK